MLSIARRRRLKTIQIKPLLGFRPVPDGTQFKFMKARLAGLGLGEASLQTMGDEGRLLVRVERQPGGELQQTAAVEKLEAALRQVDPQASFERTEGVGPKVSGELAQDGVIAVILATLAMLVYIWVRFEWPFAVGAILTLALDVVLTMGVFALTGLDFSLTAIAALLTLVGYSVNDKVVVYDRMRENLRSLRKLPLAVWGGSAVAGFAVPMAFGIAIAAASSVFIAAPILLFLGDWRGRRGHAMLARPVGEGRGSANP